MIDSDFFRLMSTTEEPAHVDFTMGLEILSGCGLQCPGCYVHRKNKRQDDDLKKVCELAEDAAKHGLRFRELTLAPTDIFSADNAEEVLSDPYFHRLMNVSPIVRLAASAGVIGMDWDRFERIMAILDNEEWYRKDMILEFFVPIDVKKVLSRDLIYHGQIMRWVNFLRHNTPKRVDWSFIVNIDTCDDLAGGIEQLHYRVKEDYDTILELQPSFVRTGKEHIIAEKIQHWNKVMGGFINAENYNKICFTSACKEFNSAHVLTVNYRQGAFHLSPFLYEQLMLARPTLALREPTFASLSAKVQQLSAKQYSYASKTEHCGNCPMLSTCTGRNVLSFMEEYSMTGCPLPRETLMKFYDTEKSISKSA